MWAGILALLTAIFQAIPIIGKWLSKPATQKVEDKQEDVKDEIDHFKKTGRPKWD